MAGYDKFTRGLMQGYGFVDDVMRSREVDKQRQQFHDERMRVQRVQNDELERIAREGKLKRGSHRYAGQQLEAERIQGDPSYVPPQSDMTGAVPGVEVAPVAGPGQVPPTPSVAAGMPALSKEPLPAMDRPAAGAAPAPVQARAATPGMEQPGDPLAPALKYVGATETPPGAQAGAAPQGAPTGGTEVPKVGQSRSMQMALKEAKEAQLRQQYLRDNGQAHLAADDVMETGKRLEAFRNQAWKEAMRRYTINKNPMEFAQAYALDIDGLDVTGAQLVGKDPKTGDDIFSVTFSQDGKEIPPQQMTRSDLEAQAMAAANPESYQKMLNERRTMLLEQQGKVQIELIKQRFQTVDGKLIDTQTGKVFGDSADWSVQTVKNDDGSETPYLFNKRTSEMKPVGTGDDQQSVNLPTKVLARVDDARTSVMNSLRTDPMGSMTGENARIAPVAQQYAADILAANHRIPEVYGGLTPDRAARIAIDLAKGTAKTGVLDDPSKPFYGERVVEFEGQKYLLNPNAWMKYARVGGSAAPPTSLPRAAAGQTQPPAPPAQGQRPAAPAAPPAAAGAASFRVSGGTPLSGAPGLAKVSPAPAAAPAATSAAMARFDAETREIEAGRRRDYSPEVKEVIRRMDAEKAARNDAMRRQMQEQEIARSREIARAARGQ